MNLIHKGATQGGEMPKPRGLRLRGKSYEIRVRVPERIRAQIGKGEIVKSLGSVSFREACRKGHLENAAIEQRFQLAEAELEGRGVEPLDDRELADLAHQFLRELEQSNDLVPFDENEQDELRYSLDEEADHFGHSDAVDDPILQNMANTFAQSRGVSLRVNQDRYGFYEAIQAAMLEHLQRRSAQLSGQPVASFNPAFLPANEGKEPSGVSLSEAVHDFLAAPERQNNAAKTKQSIEAKLHVLQDLLGADKSLGEISRADIRAFVENLTKLPSNAKQRFPGMNALEAIEASAGTGCSRLSSKTIKLYVDVANSLFKWLVQEEYATKNPVTGIRGPAIPTEPQRRPFDAQERKALLDATSKNERGKTEWLFWVTRICLWQGFRFREPLGLKAGDLKEVDGIWVFDLNPNEHRSLRSCQSNGAFRDRLC